jgi:hypothetical protein
MPKAANFAEKARIWREKRELGRKGANLARKARTWRKSRELGGKGANFAESSTNFAGKA